MHDFKTALEYIPPGQNNQFKFVISADKYAPTINEVAMLLVDQECDRSDTIVLHTHDNHLQRISKTHQVYDTFQ